MRHISTQLNALHVCNKNKRQNCQHYLSSSASSSSVLCSNQFNCDLPTFFLFPKTFRKHKQMAEHEERQSLKAHSILRAFRNCFVVSGFICPFSHYLLSAVFLQSFSHTSIRFELDFLTPRHINFPDSWAHYSHLKSHCAPNNYRVQQTKRWDLAVSTTNTAVWLIFHPSRRLCRSVIHTNVRWSASSCKRERHWRRQQVVHDATYYSIQHRIPTRFVFVCVWESFDRSSIPFQLVGSFKVKNCI